VSSVDVASAVFDAIVAHARAEAPKECCGLLIGVAGRVDESAPTRNVLASPSRYRIDPQQHFAVLRRARAAGASVVGAYHSHLRTGAQPSERDVAEAYDPSLLYVIVSLKDPQRPDVRGYHIQDGTVVEVSLLGFRLQPED
jgi:proteasome lid subunit RPN8/RPN11